MSKEAPTGPMVNFCKRKCTEGPTLYSLINSHERGLVPRTHLANVIIHDNINEKKVLDLKLRQVNRMEKKTLYFDKYQKEKFESQLHKKTDSWEKEHENFMKYLQDKLHPGPCGLQQPPVLKKLATGSPRSQTRKL